MVLIHLYDKLSPNDLIQCVENEDIFKREITLKIKDFKERKDLVNLEKLKDMVVRIVGSYENKILKVNESAIDTSLLNYLGLKEVDNNGKENN